MASLDYSILTPERVSLRYDVAGVGSRGAAVLVDGLIQGTALLLLVMIGAFAAASLGSIAIALLVLTSFLVLWAYFLVFEIAWNGQTPGKRLLHLRVIRETGYPLRPVDAVIRNLVRLVDLLPGFYAVGVLAMLLNQRSKRLGDFAAGTIVVREGAGPKAGPPRPADKPLAVGLSGEDATLVRDFLVRRQVMQPDVRAELATRLATALAKRYALTVDRDAEAFLERLV